MDDMIENMLKLYALGSMRADDTVQRQGVMNFQTASHFANLMFTRDAGELSMPEAYAMQVLAASNLAAQTAGHKTAGQ